MLSRYRCLEDVKDEYFHLFGEMGIEDKKLHVSLVPRVWLID